MKDISGNDNPEVWKDLEEHSKIFSSLSIADLFSANPQRADTFSLYENGIYFDFSKNNLNEHTIKLLLKLAEKRELHERIEEFFSGENINFTENRPALHFLSRDIFDPSANMGLDRERRQIKKTLDRMTETSLEIKGNSGIEGTGKRVKNIVNLGIGGSSLGPFMTCKALNKYSNKDIDVYFVSNLDESYFSGILKKIDPSETVFFVVSKSFKTAETIVNFKYAKNWMIERTGNEKKWKNHFYAITSEPKIAKNNGFIDTNIFLVDRAVGGRFSVSSAVNMVLMLLIGRNSFYDFLRGFHEMDKHFRKAPFGSNLPVLLALTGIWNRNFLNRGLLAVVPYGEDLKYFPDYLQQLEMESNGKNINRNGEVVSYDTVPALFGGVGTNVQHSFFQMLHQGTQIIPVDLIGVVKNGDEKSNMHNELISNMFAQSRALAFGSDYDDLNSVKSYKLSNNKKCFGNRPSNTILLDELTPYHLGQLIALYEHKVFVQGVIWDINPFDQWGVESGKKLATKILNDMNKKNSNYPDSDGSTNALINHYLNIIKTVD